MMSISAAAVRRQRFDLRGQCGVCQTRADALGDIECGGPARHVFDAAVGQFHLNGFRHGGKPISFRLERTFRSAAMDPNDSLQAPEARTCNVAGRKHEDLLYPKLRVYRSEERRGNWRYRDVRVRARTSRTAAPTSATLPAM